MDEKFPEWAKQYVLLCHVTTGIDGDPHQDLLQQKGGQGFPHLVFMDANGNVLATHEGDRTVAGFEETGSKVKGYLDLKKKVDGGEKDKGIQFTLLLAQLELGQGGKLEDVQKRLKGIGELTAEQKGKLNPLMANLEVQDALAKSQERQRQIGLDLGKQFLAMQKKGEVPTGDSELQAFCGQIMDYAASQKDAASFEAALSLMKAKYGDNPQAKRYFDMKESQLKKLKEGGK